MVGLAGIYITALIVGLSGSMAPGSLLAVVISESLRRGFWAGPLIILGHALLELVIVILLILGLGQFLAYPQVMGIIGIVGGAMLLYFALATWKTAAQSQELFAVKDSPMVSASAGGTAFAENSRAYTDTRVFSDTLKLGGAGIVASIANPYWILWWATIGAAYIATAAKYGMPGAGAFYMGHVSSDFAWFSLVAWAVASGKKFINDKVYRTILYICSGFLFLLAFYFLYLGGKLIIGA